MATSKLTEKQKRFAEEYLVDLNATAAYLRAGYSAKGASAEVNASRLLSNAKVQVYVNQLRQQQQKRTRITSDRVLEELARIAFANLTDVLSFNADGVILKDSESLPEEVKAAIASASEGKQGLRVSMHSKTQALKLLGDHLGLFNDFNMAIATLEKYGIRLIRSDSGWEVAQVDP